MFREFVHYSIHFLVPFIIAYTFYRKNFSKTAAILLCGIVIDADHLLANPIFDPNRCSINFHLLHTYPFIALYALLFLWKKTRLYGLALLLHMVADSADCLLLQFENRL